MRGAKTESDMVIAASDMALIIDLDPLTASDIDMVLSAMLLKLDIILPTESETDTLSDIALNVVANLLTESEIDMDGSVILLNEPNILDIPSLTDIDGSVIDLNVDISLETESDIDILSLNDLNMPATLLILSLMDITASVIDLGAVIILETVSDILYDFIAVSNKGSAGRGSNKSLSRPTSNTDPRSNMYLTDNGLTVSTKSDVVTLTPIIALNDVSNLPTTPAPTLIVDSDMVLNKPNSLDTESDIEMDSGNILYVDINLVTVSLSSNTPPCRVSNRSFVSSNRSFVESNRVFFSNISTEYLLIQSNRSLAGSNRSFV